MKESLLTSYSFLASLNENGTDIYKAVYIPLCKRAMSIYSKKQTKGKDTDIQKVFKDEFGIDIPLLVTQRLIVAIGKELTKKENEKIKYESFEHGKSFQFSSYTFTTLEDAYKKEERLANALQAAFEEYVNSNGGKKDETPPFSVFIEKYKNKLASFLSGNSTNEDTISTEQSYMVHVRFLQYIESNNDTLYNVVRHIFIGSIIASYIESSIDVEAKPGNNIVYYLDSKVILEALDLQNQEDTGPTIELIRLMRDSGGDVRVLDITINEIHSIIESAIPIFNKDIPTSTINEACNRTKKNKTWLTQINGRLEEYITKTLNIGVTKIPHNDLAEFSQSKDAEQLKMIWTRKGVAIHDVSAYLYVRKRRKQDANRTLVQKASCWFVSANERLFRFNLTHRENGYPCEIVMPEELTSLLFLQNPSKYITRVSNIGLGEIIAQTLFDEYPSKDIINEFDSAIKTCSDIDDDGYIILLSAISQHSTHELQKLIEEKETQPELFKDNIHSIIAKERQRRNEERDRIDKAEEAHNKDEKEKQALLEKNRDLSQKLDAIGNTIKDLVSQNAQISDTNHDILKKYDKLKLSNWKRPRYMFFGLLLLICIIVFVFYFVADAWEYNYCAKLLKKIDSFEGIKNGIATTVLYSLHGGAALLALNAIISLYMIDSNEKKAKWFYNVIKAIINK